MRQIPINEGNLVKTIICACVQMLDFGPITTDRKDLEAALYSCEELKAFTEPFIRKNLDQAIGINRQQPSALINRSLLLAATVSRSLYAEVAYKVLVGILAKLGVDFDKHGSFIREVGKALGGWDSAVAAIIAIAVLDVAVTKDWDRRKVKVLTEEAETQYLKFNKNGRGCSCHLNPPCSSCTHVGNPTNLLETEKDWELVTVDEADGRTTYAELEAAAS